ncbi:unnamed protein product, partial [marine sediment metagenome]
SQDSVYAMVKYMKRLDPILSGFSDTRKNAVLSHKREITGEGPEKDFIVEMFKCFPDFQNTLRQMLQCIDVGYQPVQNIWEVIDGKFTITSPEPRHPDKFKFDEFDQTYMADKEGEFKPVSDIEFPVLTYKKEFGNKYGEGEFNNLYWYWFIKKNITVFWSIFSERATTPILIADLPPNIGEDQARIDSFINNISTAKSISVPPGVVFSFLQADSQKSIDTFEKFLDFLNKSMAICMLGQVDTSGVAISAASLARSQVQDLVRMDIMLADIRMLETFINDKIIKPAIDYNFNNVTDYPKWRMIIEKNITAEIIKILMDSGYKWIPSRFIQDRFGIITKEEIPEDDFLELPSAQSAQP